MKKITFIVAAFLLSSLNLQAGGGWGAVMAGSPPAAAASILVANAWKNSVASGTSTNVTVSPTAGNLLVVVVSGYNGLASLHAVSDNIDGATGWVSIGSIDPGTSPNDISMWYKKNVPSGITTVTASGGVGCLLVTSIVHEVSGCSTTAPFTGGEVSATASGAVATTNPVTGTVTNATANSVFFCCVNNVEGTNPATLTINQTGSVGTWNLKNSTNSQEVNGASFIVTSVPNIIISSGTAEAHGWTTNSRGDQKMVIACFHP